MKGMEQAAGLIAMVTTTTTLTYKWMMLGGAFSFSRYITGYIILR